MKVSPTPMVFLQLKSRVRLPRESVVKLRDVAFIVCEPAAWEQKLLDMPLAKPRDKDGNRLVIDLIQIIPKIQQFVPGAHIEPMGNHHTLVELVGPPNRSSRYWFPLVWLLLFFGSMLTIMNFHADVNMLEVQIRIVEILTGKRDEQPYLFQIAYSLGLGFGMTVFFNHLFKKKWNEEPTPLEVEMYLYQENLDQFVVAEEYRKMSSKNEPAGRKP
ncbi:MULTISPECIES: stage V sporulation protein AA [Paenibacillus]|uniref:Stage V sporulation protein AA n=1 Tax=Paenibacillus campinasensis TaxID=66347 RepID=A0A268F2V3_9BACL|nr:MULTISPECIES: stage V sporulation protein AA [Paenibacillus]MUG64945.1 stage V sporulation protein AA [Paenibacillus campinasensis]PAD79664.1 stage V sporulation protein AA [Paenibacillus campinasensis]PAK53527.1 stage V sporulation protein AA [Paenibacillus sp. 7541]